MLAYHRVCVGRFVQNLYVLVCHSVCVCESLCIKCYLYRTFLCFSVTVCVCVCVCVGRFV